MVISVDSNVTKTQKCLNMKSNMCSVDEKAEVNTCYKQNSGLAENIIKLLKTKFYHIQPYSSVCWVNIKFKKNTNYNRT